MVTYKPLSLYSLKGNPALRVSSRYDRRTIKRVEKSEVGYLLFFFMCVFVKFDKTFLIYRNKKIMQDKKEYMIEYRKKNKEKIKEQRKEYEKNYYEKNKEKKNEYRKQYYDENKDTINGLEQSIHL